MSELQDYLRGLGRIHATGEAVEETSYYGQLERLLNDVGGLLSPKVMCVLTTRNRGVGVPDGGLFITSNAVRAKGPEAMVARAPERGVVEVKGPGKDVRRLARTQQVRRYLKGYGKVLVTNYRDFLVVNLGPNGEPVEGEYFTLASTDQAFWSLTERFQQVGTELETQFAGFLRRALLGAAPLSQPADLAWFLAAYAREGLHRLDSASAKRVKSLKTLRGALEGGLGLRFEGPEGERFFRSALIQTLFYGVFAAWVVWSESQPSDSNQRFNWQSAQWTLNVPMVRVLFQQLATPTTLPVGLDEILGWTEDTLARVDRKLFFDSFESGNAVQYFYEPFLQAYDPELRRQLGVWYTPPEVVRYMVARVHKSLQDDLGLELGLADGNVHILDPCTGTGSFLVEAINTIARVLEGGDSDALVAHDVKAAALSRIYGFELLPAPFVIAHLNVGLALDRLGAPLTTGTDERARVYLTNALTGWLEGDEQPRLPFPEFEEERDAAEDVKRSTPILVVFGNPPYNGFAGVSGLEEGDLVEPYKESLAEKWGITKNKLDDLYIRFFRVAERRIVERTGKGIVCFISNLSWLGDQSAVVMRQHLVKSFDLLYVDNLNGDSRETGKKTPSGLSDPSVFSTKLNPAGIQVGAAISLLVRKDPHDNKGFEGFYRDFWGSSKRIDLEASLAEEVVDRPYEPVAPVEANWYRLRPWSPRQGYEEWPSIVDLAADEPGLGLNENRSEALISLDRSTLEDRMAHYLDPSVQFEDLESKIERLTYNWARFDPRKTRARLLRDSPYDPDRIRRFLVKPFDLRWAYVDTTTKLWNEPRSPYVDAANLGSDFLLVRRRAPRTRDGAAFLLSRSLVDQHSMHKDAYVVPFWLAVKGFSSSGALSLFEVDEMQPSDEQAWRPNLSAYALSYLVGLGVTDAETSKESAQLVWQHALAIGYSPLYLEENGDAIRNDWPRVPLPNSLDELLVSARLGQYISDLLDVDTNDIKAEPGIQARRSIIAQIGRPDGKALAPDAGDLGLTIGWAIEQGRTQRSGAISRIVMPGRGHTEVRERTVAERETLTDEELALLGSKVLDVYLNENVCWRGVPQAAWDFKVGGFQVLRKWLSYRDRNIVGRDLTVAEVRQFASICRRIVELVLLGPKLDANYIAATGASRSSP